MSPSTGEVKGMSNEAYHSHPGIGSSSLKEARKSMAHFKTAYDGQLEFSKATRDAFDLGNAADQINIEGRTDLFIMGPDVSSRATKEWKGFVEANPGKIVLKPDEYFRVMSMHEVFKNHPVVSAMVKGCKVQHSYFTVDHATGLAVKARPDLVRDDFMIDYKTVGKPITDHTFASTVEALGYHISAAHYSEVYKSVTKTTIKDFYFIVQEKSAPFAIRVFRLSPIARDRGLALRNDLLAQVAVAKKENKFPGYAQDIIDIDLPKYVYMEELDEEAV